MEGFYKVFTYDEDGISLGMFVVHSFDWLVYMLDLNDECKYAHIHPSCGDGTYYELYKK